MTEQDTHWYIYSSNPSGPARCENGSCRKPTYFFIWQVGRHVVNAKAFCSGCWASKAAIWTPEFLSGFTRLISVPSSYKKRRHLISWTPEAAEHAEERLHADIVGSVALSKGSRRRVSNAVSIG